METPSATDSSASSLELHNRPVCVITGGSAGIGLATAKQFVREGYNLLICGRDESRLDRALEEIQVVDQTCKLVTCCCDLENVDAAKQLGQTAVEQFGKVDVLVNNAAMAPLCNLDEISDDTFERTIAINVRSVFYLTRTIWTQMKGQGSGVIINLSSMAAVDPFPGFSLYGSTKAWVDLMTTALATEGQEHGIRVYSIRPGAVETQMLRGLFPDFPSDQCVTPETIADQIWRCVDQPETYVSGSHIPVSKQVS